MERRLARGREAPGAAPAALHCCGGPKHFRCADSDPGPSFWPGNDLPLDGLEPRSRGWVPFQRFSGDAGLAGSTCTPIQPCASSHTRLFRPGVGDSRRIRLSR